MLLIYDLNIGMLLNPILRKTEESTNNKSKMYYNTQVAIFNILY